MKRDARVVLFIRRFPLFHFPQSSHFAVDTSLKRGKSKIIPTFEIKSSETEVPGKRLLYEY